MSNPNKDYYKILGVDKEAEPDIIKKSYRKLAMQYHPDQNQGDATSEAKFKDVAEAYEILSDPNKRSNYDNGGMNRPQGNHGFTGNPFDPFDMFRGSHSNMHRQPIGSDTKVVFRASLSQIITGGKVRVKFTRQIACDECYGQGSSVTNDTCKACQGSGQLGSRMANMTFVTTCPKCNGTGNQMKTCKKCNGKAYKAHTEKAEVVIPKGIGPLTMLQIKNKGNEVYRGNQKIIGHTYLVIDYPRSEQGVSLDSGNIYTLVRVPFNTIIAEETITIDVLGCKDIKFKVDITKTSGHQYVVNGAGVTEDKKAFVKVFIDAPKNKLSEDEKTKLNKIMGEVYGKPLQKFKTTES